MYQYRSIIVAVLMTFTSCEFNMSQESLAELKLIELDEHESPVTRVVRQCVRMCDEAVSMRCAHEDCYETCADIAGQTHTCIMLASSMYSCIEDYGMCEQDTFEEICELPILYYDDMCGELDV